MHNYIICLFHLKVRNELQEILYAIRDTWKWERLKSASVVDKISWILNDFTFIILVQIETNWEM